MLQVVQKISYLLEGNWMASDRTTECLQTHQFTRRGFSIKDCNTIHSHESLQQTQPIHNMNSVLASLFDQPTSRMNFIANSRTNSQKRCCHPLAFRGGVLSVRVVLNGDRKGSRSFHFIVMRDVQTKIMRVRLWD